jgi:hypothetical protein
MVEKYFTPISQEPNLPFLYLGIQKNPDELSSYFQCWHLIIIFCGKSSFFKQLHKINPHLNPFHFILIFWEITIFSVYCFSFIGEFWN